LGELVGSFVVSIDILDGYRCIEKILDKANEVCADLRERQKCSLCHFGYARGLGRGFMGVLENELFESLKACDALTDGWERKACSGEVFIDNVMAMDGPSYPSKYPDADQPLYPRTDVESRHKNECYKHQTTL
jgi:hypothetical protein